MAGYKDVYDPFLNGEKYFHLSTDSLISIELNSTKLITKYSNEIKQGLVSLQKRHQSDFESIETLQERQVHLYGEYRDCFYANLDYISQMCAVLLVFTATKDFFPRKSSIMLKINWSWAYMSWEIFMCNDGSNIKQRQHNNILYKNSKLSIYIVSTDNNKATMNINVTSFWPIIEYTDLYFKNTLISNI